jgi:hypothetical protein
LFGELTNLVIPNAKKTADHHHNCQAPIVKDEIVNDATITPLYAEDDFELFIFFLRGLISDSKSIDARTAPTKPVSVHI